MRRLLALDLDGTLLRTDGTLGHRTRATLARACQEGWVLFPVTARPLRAALPLARQEGWPEIACSNGAVVVDLNGTQLASAPLTFSSAIALMSTARSHLPGVAFAAEWGTHMRSDPGYDALRRGETLPKAATSGPPFWTLEPAGPAPFKLMARHTQWNGLQLAEQLRTFATPLGLSATCSASTFVEFTDQQASKVQATRDACLRHGISRENVVAFGDMPVDAVLLRWAGHGVAVGNAHPDVLHAADEVTGTNDKDGVAQVIERLLRAQQGM